MDKYSQIRNAFEEREDKENAVVMSKYMRDKFDFYGLPTPKRKEVYKNLLKEEKKNKIIDWQFLDKCCTDPHREFQYLILDYLSALKKYLNYDDIPQIKKYIKSRQWWDTIDGFDRIIGDIGLMDNRVDLLMLEWSEDDDFWIRRIAIDHQLCRKEKTNIELLEKIIVNNLGSDEFFINKAIGWSLRDYSKTNAEWVENFLNKYKNKMSKLSVKEASKYI